MSQGQRDSKWTPEQDAELRAQVEAGNSLAIAAVAINRKFGTSFSRNAAIGRANRIGLSSQKKKPAESIEAAPTIKRRITRVVRANGNSDKMRFMEGPMADMSKLRCVEVVPLGLDLVDVSENGCRYPYGDGPFLFCGHPKIEGASYCGPHWAITFARSRGTNEAASENRRRNLRKQHKLALWRHQHEEAHHSHAHQGQGRSAEVIAAEIP